MALVELPLVSRTISVGNRRPTPRERRVRASGSQPYSCHGGRLAPTLARSQRRVGNASQPIPPMSHPMGDELAVAWDTLLLFCGIRHPLPAVTQSAKDPRFHSSTSTEAPSPHLSTQRLLARLTQVPGRRPHSRSRARRSDGRHWADSVTPADSRCECASALINRTDAKPPSHDAQETRTPLWRRSDAAAPTRQGRTRTSSNASEPCPVELIHTQATPTAPVIHAPISAEALRDLETAAEWLRKSLSDASKLDIAYDLPAIILLSADLESNRLRYAARQDIRDSFVWHTGSFVGRAAIDLGTAGSAGWAFGANNPIVLISENGGGTVIFDPFLVVNEHIDEGARSSIVDKFVALIDILRGEAKVH